MINVFGLYGLLAIWPSVMQKLESETITLSYDFRTSIIQGTYIISTVVKKLPSLWLIGTKLHDIRNL